MQQFEYDGVRSPSLRLAQAARRAHYLRLMASGMNSTAAACTVGVSKRTGKVWRNGRTRTSGRNEAPAVDWYRGDMPMPKPVDGRYLSQDERIAIADGLRAGDSLRAIARRLGRNVSTVSREIVANRHSAAGRYEPHRAQQLSTARLARPKPSKITSNPDLLAAVRDKLAVHWSPEQISAWDQGAELALHQDIKAALDMDVYFCDPHSPWQRGTNENTNGLLRQYFPKRTDLSGFSEAYLDAVAEELNDRPRKTLDRLGQAQREDPRTHHPRGMMEPTTINHECCDHR